MSPSQSRLHARTQPARCGLITALQASDDPQLHKRANRLLNCCYSPLVRVDAEGMPHLTLNACRDRLCPRCQRERSYRLKLKVTTLVTTFNAPRFITLTLKHRDEGLGSMIDRLFTGFRKLRRDPVWKKNVKAGVYLLEPKLAEKDGRWHAHLHVITDGSFIHFKALSKAWKRATLDSDNVDIRAVHDRADAAAYVAKYVTKGADGHKWPMCKICEWAKAMHGRRMVHTFGLAHAVKVEVENEPEERPTTRWGCSLQWLNTLALRGHRQAAHALDIFGRIDDTWRAACGFLPYTGTYVRPPLETWELKHAASIAVICNALPYTWKLSDEEPAAPPPEETTGRLFDIVRSPV